MSSKNIKPVLIWLFAGCVLIYAMVVIGGLTRLTHSGLSMVNWSLFGNAPPSTDQEWTVLFEKYKLYPEYQKVNFNFSISEFKSIFWLEYIHRFLGRSIGVLFIVPMAFFWINKMLDRKLITKLLALLLLGGLQGLLGWYMVKSGLTKDPHVSHFRLAAHLISALTVFGFTFWVALSLMFQRTERTGPLADKTTILNRLSILLFCVTVLQIVYGAFVAGLKAGYLCPTWPKMCGEWIPDAVLILKPVWKNFTEAGAGVQFVHRYLAYILLILVGLIYYQSKRTPRISHLQIRIVNTLVVIIICQFTFGVLTLLYGVPVILGILHQTGAFFLFATSLLLLFSFRIQE